VGALAYARIKSQSNRGPGQQRPNADPITILKSKTGIPLTKRSTAAEAYLAVARLGGHIKNNGAPGWRVRGRGYHELLTLEVGYKIAKRETCDR